MFDFKKLQKMQKEMQDKMSTMQDELGKQQVEGVAGGGMVKVIVTGNQEVVDVKIDPQAVDPEDIEMLQDLIVAAANAAMEKAKALSQKSLSSIMPAGVNLPGLPF